MSTAESPRQIVKCSAHLRPINTEALQQDGLPDWFAKQANEHDLRFLLAHCDDGVVWGRFDGNPVSLVTSANAAKGHPEAENACPPLKLETLQQVRAFGDDAELLLWREEVGRWRARVIDDKGVQPGERRWEEAFDEPQLLWGTRAEPLDFQFTLLTEGASGLRHAAPIESQGLTQAQLIVRHYLTQQGFAHVEASRLLRLEWRQP